ECGSYGRTGRASVCDRTAPPAQCRATSTRSLVLSTRTTTRSSSSRATRWRSAGVVVSAAHTAGRSAASARIEDTAASLSPAGAARRHRSYSSSSCRFARRAPPPRRSRSPAPRRVPRPPRVVRPLGPPGLDRRPLPPQLPLPGQGGVLPLDVRDRRQARLQRRRLDGREQLVRDQRIERPAVREPLAERLGVV